MTWDENRLPVLLLPVLLLLCTAVHLLILFGRIHFVDFSSAFNTIQSIVITSWETDCKMCRWAQPLHLSLRQSLQQVTHFKMLLSNLGLFLNILFYFFFFFLSFIHFWSLALARCQSTQFTFVIVLSAVNLSALLCLLLLTHKASLHHGQEQFSTF